MRALGTDSGSSFSPFDVQCMKRAFALAGRGMGKTAPNPMVGAVLAKNGRIIGEGWHRRYGGAHAEDEAVTAALAEGNSPKGADLYCTLEPCCFTAPDKNRPPCTGLIIKSKIKRVFVANLDPHPKVRGKGIALLKQAGIPVQAGLCSETGEELNRAFFSFHRLGRPFVHLKMAQSLDGRIAAQDGGARWISDETARRMVHHLRGFYDAALIGRGTAVADDPELTVRLARGRNPRRIILDSSLAIPETARILRLPDPEKTTIMHTDRADSRKAEILHSCGAELISINADSLSLNQVLAALGERGIQSVLVEGGAGVFSSFLREGLWDRLSVFIAPVILGGGVNAVSGLGITTMDQALRFTGGSFRRVGSQILFEVQNNVYGID